MRPSATSTQQKRGKEKERNAAPQMADGRWPMDKRIWLQHASVFYPFAHPELFLSL
jgi:hypothetical protein